MKTVMLRKGNQNSTTGTVSSEKRRTPVEKARNGGRKTVVALWTVQGLLAALFLFAGGVKLMMPVEMLAAQSPFPGWFLRFIGAAEALGALGLILPGLLRIRPILTPLAAAGLVIIMIGATVSTAALLDVASALMPLVVGLLAAFVAYGRWQLAPQRTVSRRSALQPAI